MHGWNAAPRLDILRWVALESVPACPVETSDVAAGSCSSSSSSQSERRSDARLPCNLISTVHRAGWIPMYYVLRRFTAVHIITITDKYGVYAIKTDLSMPYLQVLDQPLLDE